MSAADRLPFESSEPTIASATGLNATLARMYLLQLLQRDQAAAANVIFEAQREGKSLAELYESVIAPALVEVGRMWQVQEASVADEHYCNAVTHMIMSQLKARAPRKKSNGMRMLATTAGGDRNEIGIRMLADLFEIDGWYAEYLGSTMPTHEIVASLADANGESAVELLTVSASASVKVRDVADFIAAVRSHPTAGLIPILVIGGPFRDVGADGCASDAASALRVAVQLVDATKRRSR